MEVLSIAMDAIITCVIGVLVKKVVDLAKGMREADDRNRAFEVSMQRAEIIHAFQRHVEDGNPMSLEEAAHLDACYQAYHAAGGNNVGTLLYEKIKENAKIVTKIDADDIKIGGTE